MPLSSAPSSSIVISKRVELGSPEGMAKAPSSKRFAQIANPSRSQYKIIRTTARHERSAMQQRELDRAGLPHPEAPEVEIRLNNPASDVDSRDNMPDTLQLNKNSATFVRLISTHHKTISQIQSQED